MKKKALYLKEREDILFSMKYLSITKDKNKEEEYRKYYAENYVNGNVNLLDKFLKSIGLSSKIDVLIEFRKNISILATQHLNFLNTDNANYLEQDFESSSITKNCWNGLELLAERFLIKGILEIKKKYIEYSKKISISSLQLSFCQSFSPIVKIAILRVIILEYYIDKEKYGIDNISSYIKAIDQKYVDKIYVEYPGLYRVLLEQYNDTINYFLSIVDNFIADREELVYQSYIDESSILNSIDFGNSDIHKYGESVAFFNFSKGERIVYKPRTSINEASIYNFFSFVKNHLLKFDFHKVKTLSKVSYCWQEFIEYQTCKNIDEIKKFYYNYGVMSCVFYFLNVSDQHYGNLIAMGQYPVFFDMETIFQNNILTENTEYNKLNLSLIGNSALNSGLYPINLSDKMNEVINISAFLSPEQYSTPVKGLNIITDELGSVKLERVFQNIIIDVKNIPTFKGEFVSKKSYIKDVIKGFKDAYTVFLRKKSQIIQIINEMPSINVRTVIRHTYYYNLLLEESVHPSLLQDCGERDIFFSTLMNDTLSLPYLEKTVFTEYLQLRNLNTPIFYNNIDSCHLLDLNCKSLGVFFRENARKIIINKVFSANKSDMRKQICEISKSIFTLDDNA